MADRETPEYNRNPRFIKLKRLQVTVSSLNVSALKWIKAMYFVNEGILKHYGVDGSDYKMFARYF